jgi:prepilin-type N-terminal cleavage/methylation domain-containing protein
MPSAPSTTARTRSRPGFSMLELITVLVIAGILVGLGAGRISTYVTQQRVAKASSAITNDLQQAFAIAGRVRRPVRIVLDTAKMQLSITDRAQTTLFRRVGLGKEFQLQSSNVAFYPSTPLEVYPNGLASDTMWIRFRTTVASNTYSRLVRVSRAGMIQVLNQ